MAKDSGSSEASVSSTNTAVSTVSSDDKSKSSDQVKEKYHALLSTMEQQRTHHGRGLVNSSPSDMPSPRVHDFPPRTVQKHEKLEKHVRTGLPPPNIVHQKQIMQPMEDKPNPCSAKVTRM